MLERFFFSRMSIRKQVAYVKKRGTIIGSRLKDGRKLYIYMLRDLFVEVTYQNDNMDLEAEQLNILQGLDNLNDHLEKEFKTTF